MKLHKLRYQCKFHLQLCAVMSQLNKHIEALDHGKESTRLCQELIKHTEVLCRQHVRQLNQAQLNQRRKSAGGRDQSQNDTPNAQNGVKSPYGAVGLDTSMKKTRASSQRGNSRTKKRKASNQGTIGEIDISSTSFNSQKSGKKSQRRGRNREPQPTSEELNNSRSSSQSTSVLIRASIDAESLEKIHTFSLKRNESSLREDSCDSSRSVTGANISQTPSSAGKAFYVEEKVKVMDNHVIMSDGILKELVSQICDFQEISMMKTHERNQFFNEGRLGLKKRLRISFGSEQEIERMRKDSKFKLNARNVLGIKHQDDWIFNLNIGNIMHLSPLSFDDLNSYAYIQRPTGSTGLKSVTADYLNELHKDTLLEKILFLAVSYFCVGTELRFLASKKEDYTRKDSEIWHAKAMHTVCSFLPLECPLVSHVINSYIKHHLSIKEKEKLEKKQSLQTLKRESVDPQEISQHQTIEGDVSTNQKHKISLSPQQQQAALKQKSSRDKLQVPQSSDSASRNLGAQFNTISAGETKTSQKPNIKLKKIKDQVETFYKNKNANSTSQISVAQSKKRESANAVIRPMTALASAQGNPPQKSRNSEMFASRTVATSQGGRSSTGRGEKPPAPSSTQSLKKYSFGSTVQEKLLIMNSTTQNSDSKQAKPNAKPKKQKFLSSTLKKKLYDSSVGSTTGTPTQSHIQSNNLCSQPSHIKKMLSGSSLSKGMSSNSGRDKKIKMRKGTGGQKGSQYASTHSIQDHWQQMLNSQKQSLVDNKAQKIFVFPIKKKFPSQLPGKQSSKNLQGAGPSSCGLGHKKQSVPINFYKGSHNNSEIERPQNHSLVEQQRHPSSRNQAMSGSRTETFDHEAHLISKSKTSYTNDTDRINLDSSSSIGAQAPRMLSFKEQPPSHGGVHMHGTGPIKNYHFENINVINNVNIYDSSKQQQSQQAIPSSNKNVVGAQIPNSSHSNTLSQVASRQPISNKQIIPSHLQTLPQSQLPSGLLSAHMPSPKTDEKRRGLTPGSNSGALNQQTGSKIKLDLTKVSVD